ncbi:hypothetical protein BJ138DRAFT_1119377 [Hygrophoropsis aurantiaca]|uniref:Uncharacterized protein n=1 Tax=Hygrophoropsis aurantiaca TaxID=72124 RepID=A0ACB7ZUV8_9AGAM|nr:hypothetical protein BJ138DRAFT_1119377 [Hygrophoropsis aurantiaca]
MATDPHGGGLLTSDFIANQPEELGRGSRTYRPTSRSETFRADIASRNQRRERRISQANPQTPTSMATDENASNTDDYQPYHDERTSHGQQGQWGQPQAPFNSYYPNGWNTAPQINQVNNQAPIMQTSYYGMNTSLSNVNGSQTETTGFGQPPVQSFLPEQTAEPQDDDEEYERAANDDENMFNASNMPTSGSMVCHNQY